MKFALTLCLLAFVGCKTSSQREQPEPLYLHLVTGDHVVATATVPLGKHFSAGGLTGMVERRGEKFYAKVVGDCEGTGTSLDGYLELEKSRLPTAMGGPGFFTLGFFVLSTNADFRPPKEVPQLDAESN